jgi:hypothetical protein
MASTRWRVRELYCPTTYIETLRRVREIFVAVNQRHVLLILSVFLSLVVHHPKRVYRKILSSVSRPAVPYFSLSHKRLDFPKKKLLNIKCVQICIRLLSKAFLILRRISRDIITNVYRSSCEAPDILVRF